MSNRKGRIAKTTIAFVCLLGCFFQGKVYANAPRVMASLNVALANGPIGGTTEDSQTLYSKNAKILNEKSTVSLSNKKGRKKEFSKIDNSFNKEEELKSMSLTFDSIDKIPNNKGLERVLPVIVRDRQEVGGARQRAEALLESGLYLVKDQQIRQAIEVIEKAWLADPEYSLARDALIALYFSRNDYINAWNVLIKNVVGDDVNPNIWIQRAYVAQKIEGEKKALEVLERVPSLSGSMENVGLYKFSLLVRMKMLDQALDLTTSEIKKQDGRTKKWMTAHLVSLILTEHFEDAKDFFAKYKNSLDFSEHLELELLSLLNNAK